MSWSNLFSIYVNPQPLLSCSYTRFSLFAFVECCFLDPDLSDTYNLNTRNTPPFRQSKSGHSMQAFEKTHAADRTRWVLQEHTIVPLEIQSWRDKNVPEFSSMFSTQNGLVHTQRFIPNPFLAVDSLLKFAQWFTTPYLRFYFLAFAMGPHLLFFCEEKVTGRDPSRKLAGISFLSMYLKGVFKTTSRNAELSSELLRKSVSS